MIGDTLGSGSSIPRDVIKLQMEGKVSWIFGKCVFCGYGLAPGGFRVFLDGFSGFLIVVILVRVDSPLNLDTMIELNFRLNSPQM